MKNTKISLWKWALGACLLFLGAQNAFAGMNCGKTVYLSLPDGWKSAFAVAGGQKAQFTKSGIGNWLSLSTDQIGGQNAATNFFIEETGANDCNSAKCIRKDSMNVMYMSVAPTTPLFTCDDFGTTGEIWISAHPEKEKVTYVSNAAPNAKYFFVMIPPEFEEWMSSVPMISMDGGATGKPMTAVNGMCGWYSYLFLVETITDNVVLYRDDDTERLDMIGMFGNWETGNDATPIPLGMLFNAMEANNQDTLFFVPDEEQKTNEDGYYYSAAEVDGIEGTCEYTMAAIIYDTDADLHPLFSCYSQGASETNDGCQQVNQTNATKGVDKTAALKAIWDCIGITPGLVQDELDRSVPQKQRKPKLTSKGKECFLSDEIFDMMFNYKEGVNEKSCYDMPFARSTDGKWEFDSDFYQSKGAGYGGFYPAEANTDSIILAADPNQKPLSAARTKRAAEGPVFYGPELRAIDPKTDMPVIDVLCKGPGWEDGMLKCDGLFGDGAATETAIKGAFKNENMCVFGWSCEKSAPTGWHFFESGTDDEVEASDASATYRWSAKRNQHYCFESHAKFTYKPGLKFNFRGDDDIWVYIDDKLAVDLGGTHLASPGYVDLDNFKGASGTLEVGNQYDIDIFFCDRRTTMSNVRIKTNMYIQQKTDIQVKGKKNPNNPAEKIYELCYTKSGDGSCAAATSDSDEEITCCGDDFNKKPGCTGLAPKFTLVKGKKVTDPVVEGYADMAGGKKYACDGIDLTNPSAPVVNSAEVCLGAGRYTLFVTIDGKSRKVQSFTPAGELDVVYKDAKAVYIDEEDSKNDKTLGEFHLTTTEMGGKYVEVYVSNVGDYDGEVVVQPALAAGMTYTLDFNILMEVVYKDAEGNYHVVHSGDVRTIGESGIDTLYATVKMDDLKEALQEFEIKVTGRPNAQKISFYLPTISFVSAPDSTAKQVTGLKPNDDGNYDEYWKGSIYELYLAVLKPSVGSDGKVKYYPCKEDCEGLEIHKGAETSSGIDFIPETVKFHDGYATISVRSLKEYRWDKDPSIHSPANVVAEYNDYVKAVYSPIYFRNPPVPFPVLADVFDVKGSLPGDAYKIPEKYFSRDKEYLDGIGDSVAIYYDRRIHMDSVPMVVCLLWDSTAQEADLLGAAVEHNAYKEGFSNIPKDSLTPIACNALVKRENIDIVCKGGVSKEYCQDKQTKNDSACYCSNYITINGLTLSQKVKTQGIGKVHSFALFSDKGKEVKQGFVGALTDRIAPIPLRAEVRSLRDGDEVNGYDSLIVYFSEPVKLVASENRKKSMTYYLNSAIEWSEDQRYADASSSVAAENDPSVTTEYNEGDERLEGRVKFMYKPGKEGSSKKVTPHVGDYIRMGGDLNTVFWSDTVDISVSGGDTLRSTGDVGYHWNSPTAYDEETRLPSPWIPVVGDAEIDVIQNKFASTANADSIWLATQQPVTVNAYRTNMTKEEVLTKEKGRPGHFVKADMSALFYALSPEEKDEVLKGDWEDVFFYYEVRYYTNLGSYVAGKSQKIYCDDNLNFNNYGQYFFGGQNSKCIDNNMDRNFYIGWNMRSDKGRMVGTGAYIVKLNSFVKLGSAGKDAKQESTSVWGIKRSPKPVTDYLKAAGN